MNGLQSFVAANEYASSIWAERIDGFWSAGEVPTNVLREFEAINAVISAETNIKKDDMESCVSYQQLDFTYDSDLYQLIVRKPALKLHEPGCKRVGYAQICQLCAPAEKCVIDTFQFPVLEKAHTVLWDEETKTPTASSEAVDDSRDN
ncbi:hypothetical protein ABG067_006548 [Albugo candida]